MRGRGWIAAVIVLLTACTGSPHHAGSPTPSRSPRDDHRREHLQPLVLTADYSAPIARWHVVASIPYGAAHTQLGFIPEGPRSPQPMVPFAFAIAPDRSIWILDEVKKRVAHFSSSGSYVGEITGLHFDRFHAHPRDLVMLGRDPVVLEQGQGLRGIVEVPAAGGGFDRTPVLAGSRPVRVDELVQTTGPLVGYVSGRPFHPPARPSFSPYGIYRMDVPGSGTIHRIPGMRLGDGNFIWLHAEGSNPFQTTYTTRDVTATRNLTIRVSAGGRRISAVAGPVTQAALEHGVAAYVSVAPGKPGTAARYGDGRWFLELSDDSTPLVWERLPSPTFDDETQVRHITAGPGGSIYLMTVTDHDVRIYRR